MTNPYTCDRPVLVEQTGPVADSATLRSHIKALLVTAFALPAFAVAQQTDSQQPQMPEAPRAPTVETIEANTASSNRSSQTGGSGPQIKAQLSLDLQQIEGQDEEDELRRDTGRGQLQLSLSIEQQWSYTTRIVGQLELTTRRFTEEVLNTTDEEFAYDLERLFVEFKPDKSFRLRAGRQGFDDPMETIIDEDLDGLSVRFDKSLFELELSHTRKDWFEASTFTSSDETTNTMGSLQLTPGKDRFWMPYVLHRSTADTDDKTWMGIQGIVEPANSAWRYWFHAMALDGEEKTPPQTTDDGEIVAGRTRQVGGYAVDIGINWSPGGKLKPTYTLALAHATGGSREDRFRQSGLHDNDFALNGKNTFRYLGEALDPELTNIQIITIGAGAKLARKWSADIALHAYQQLEVEDSLRGTDIEFEPLGNSDDLGTGADLVIAYEPTKRLDITATAGTFMPGNAFESNQDPAWLGRLELEYSF